MRGIFVGGTGRSGTTVLRKCFSFHPDVVTMPGELRLVCDPNGILDTFNKLRYNWDPYMANHAIHHLRGLLTHVSSMSTKDYRQHDTDRWTGGTEWYMDRVDQLIDDLIVGKDSARWTGAHPESDHMFETQWRGHAEPLREFVLDLYRQRNPDAQYFVDDTPYLSCHFADIERVFPDSHYIFCIRHPKDIYSSFLHGGKHWTPSDPTLAALRISETLTKFNYQLSEVNAYIWALEDFAKDPEGELAELCRSIGLDDSHAFQMSIPFDKEKTNIGRHREELSDVEEIAYLEHLKWAEKVFGYE